MTVPNAVFRAADARIDAHPRRIEINAILNSIAARAALAKVRGDRSMMWRVPVLPGGEAGAAEVMGVVAESIGACCADMCLMVRVIESPGSIAIELTIAGAS